MKAIWWHRARGFAVLGSFVPGILLLRGCAKETARSKGKEFCIKIAVGLLMITKIGKMHKLSTIENKLNTEPSSRMTCSL